MHNETVPRGINVMYMHTHGVYEPREAEWRNKASLGVRRGDLGLVIGPKCTDRKGTFDCCVGVVVVTSWITIGTKEYRQQQWYLFTLKGDKMNSRKT